MEHHTVNPGFVDLIEKRMRERGFSVDDHLLAQFNIYWRELKDWNSKINLTSITDDLEIIDKHFIDSLLLVRNEPLAHGIRVADVGAGAGFPGIPIKIFQPDIQLSLLESIGKKARFLEHIVGQLELENVHVVNARAEEVARSPEHREKYDLVIARTVARMRVLAEYCLPLLSVGGRFIAYKGHEAATEVKEAETAIEKLGGQLENVEWDESVPDNADRRSLVSIKKIRETPDKYPRRPGVPRKRPL